MSELDHLSAESLQGYVEGAIGSAERAVLESHLAACAKCSGELGEWRSLFAVLTDLPQLAPSTGFTDRVLARVRIPEALPVWTRWAAGARQLAHRLTPRSAGAWAVAAAFITLPLLLGGGVVTWLVSKDYITVQSLWAFATHRAETGMQSLGASVLTAMMESSITGWLLAQARSLATSAGARGLGALAVGLGGLTMASLWILYRNLLRTPTREVNHVSAQF